MPRWLALVTLAPLTGCADLFFNVEGLTNPLTGLGLVIGTEAPESGSIDLSGTGIEVGTGMTLFLADAGNVTDVSNAPVVGATVSLDDVDATGEGDGTYVISPTDGPDYVAGQTAPLLVDIGDYHAEAAIGLPSRPAWTAPASHAAGADLLVDLSGQGYDSVLILVVDAESGDLTWSNEPQTVREMYDFTHGAAETAVTVPGAEAFPTSGGYVLGVAGMQHTRAVDLTEFNTALSTLMAGKMRTYGLVVP